MTPPAETFTTVTLGKARLTAMSNARKMDGPGEATAYYVVHTDVYPTSSVEHRQLFDSGLGGTGGDPARLAKALEAAGVGETSVSEVYMSHFREDCIDSFFKDGRKDAGLLLSAAMHFMPGGDYMPETLTPESEARMNALSEKITAAFGDRINVFTNLGFRSLLAEKAAGFTPGHTVYYLDLGGDIRLAFIGDLVRSFPEALEHPEKLNADAVDAALDAASRKAVLDKIIANGWFVAGTHFPFPGIGRVTAVNGGYAFSPVSEVEINTVVAEAVEKAGAAKAAQPKIPILPKAAMEILNHTEGDVYVDGDPNWDDQVLKVGGKKIHSPACIAKGKKATVSVLWKQPADELMMGLYLSGNQAMKGVHSLTVGYRDGVMDVTEQDMLGGDPGFAFTVVARSTEIVEIELTDSK